MISIVIPVFNEHESLKTLHEEITTALGRASLDHELIFVDDGSSDGSWSLIAGLAKSDPRVRGIRLRRNFGKAAALSAAFASARGDTLLTLDADLQDDPAEIPNFLQAMSDGLDV